MYQDDFLSIQNRHRFIFSYIVHCNDAVLVAGGGGGEDLEGGQ